LKPSPPRPQRGVDTASLYDTAGDDLLELTPTMGRLTGGGYSFQVNTSRRSSEFTSGGSDKAVFTAYGADAFEVCPDWPA